VSAVRAWALIHAVMRIGLGAFLAFEALMFLAHRPGLFARLGYSEGARVALGACEAAAAILMIFPATFEAGAVGLIAVLAWAAGFHFGLHERAASLFVDMALVGLLLASRRSAAAPREADA